MLWPISYIFSWLYPHPVITLSRVIFVFVFVFVFAMLFRKSAKVDRSVVAEGSHLNNKHGPWWNDHGLRTLNFLILVPLMSEYIQGYDSSLINNVQQLPVWQKGAINLFNLQKTETFILTTRASNRIQLPRRISFGNFKC
jgi:hypothetical protein